MIIEAMKLALAALETCRIRSVSEWSAEDITPKNVTAAIAALRTAIQQAEAQQPATGEPVYWEWRHLSTHPDTVDFGKWSEWERVEARSAIHTIEDALAEFRAYIAQGYKYELRALYDHPAPSVPDVDFELQELREIERAMDDVADCGKTDVVDTLLLRAVQAGFLECTHFHVANRGALQEAIDAAMLAAK